MARTGGEPAVPGMIPGGIASHPIPGRGSSNPQRRTGCSCDDSRWCSVEKTVLFIAGHRFCLYQGVSIHTSGLAVASALMASIILPSGCGGVYVAGVWTAMAGGSPAGQSLQDPVLWVAWIGDQGQQTPVARQRLSSTSCLGGWRWAAADTRSEASL